MSENKIDNNKIEHTTSIQLNIPNSCYFAIKRAVDRKKEQGQKATLHDEMVELLKFARSKKKLD